MTTPLDLITGIKICAEPILYEYKDDIPWCYLDEGLAIHCVEG